MVPVLHRGCVSGSAGLGGVERLCRDVRYARFGRQGPFLGGPVDWLKGDQERVEGLGMDFIVENAGTAGALWAALEAASANQEPIVLFNCCLLYTSPSPRDRSLSRMPSSA